MLQRFKSEKELISQLKKGNPQAVEAWFNQYYPKLLAVAKLKAKTDKDAEDLTQETLINCLKQIQIFRGEASLKTWMMTILRHEIADYYRKKYAKKAIRTLPLTDFLLKEELKDSSEVDDRVKQVLGKMLSRRKKLLLMKYVDGLKVSEIAKKVGKTFKAVEADLYRARTNFKELYVTLDSK